MEVTVVEKDASDVDSIFFVVFFCVVGTAVVVVVDTVVGVVTFLVEETTVVGLTNDLVTELVDSVSWVVVLTIL